MELVVLGLMIRMRVGVEEAGSILVDAIAKANQAGDFNYWYLEWRMDTRTPRINAQVLRWKRVQTFDMQEQLSRVGAIDKKQIGTGIRAISSGVSWGIHSLSLRVGFLGRPFSLVSCDWLGVTKRCQVLSTSSQNWLFRWPMMPFRGGEEELEGSIYQWPLGVSLSMPEISQICYVWKAVSWDVKR